MGTLFRPFVTFVPFVVRSIPLWPGSLAESPGGGHNDVLRPRRSRARNRVVGS